jgi:hypothetical protein
VAQREGIAAQALGIKGKSDILECLAREFGVRVTSPFHEMKWLNHFPLSFIVLC